MDEADMITIPDVAATWAVLGFVAALLGGAWRAFVVLDARMTKRAHEASTVAVAKAGAVEIKADRTSDELAAFKLEVARGYVTTDYLRRLEDRMDKGFSGLRDMLMERQRRSSD